jgi:hypothetical protein
MRPIPVPPREGPWPNDDIPGTDIPDPPASEDLPDPFAPGRPKGPPAPLPTPG